MLITLRNSPIINAPVSPMKIFLCFCALPNTLNEKNGSKVPNVATARAEYINIPLFKENDGIEATGYST